jgi:hypothetical protein
LAVSTWRQLDLAEQVLMKRLLQQTEQMKKWQHLPSNQLKMDQEEEVGMEYELQVVDTQHQPSEQLPVVPILATHELHWEESKCDQRIKF